MRLDAPRSALPKPKLDPPNTPRVFPSAVHFSPSSVSTTCGATAWNLAGAWLTHRSPGIQVMST